METKSVCELVREMEQNDTNGNTKVSQFVTISMRTDIDTTDAYLNSKHISGEVDYMGREKPFFNICIGARNIWFRATDIDSKDVKIRATKQSSEILAFLASIKFQEWLKKVNFGQFLNDWGLALATHGSTIVEFVEKDEMLHCSVLDWNNIIVDPIDFDNNLKIKKLWFTPAQLKKNKNYDQELVDKLLDYLTTRKTSDGQQKDSKSDYILVYEVHGELPLSILKESQGEEATETDEDTYVQQMHVVTFQEKKDNAGEYEDYTLFSGREAKCPQMITHLLRKDGQTYTGGAIKNLFEAQWMVNHSEMQIKNHLDTASKLLLQSADGALAGKNVFTNVEDGEIFTHNGNPVTRIDNRPDIAAMQSNKSDWQTIAGQINGIGEAMMGENAPSGTAWRQVQALLQESHSLFELFTENKGLAIIEMMREYIVPYFKKQLDNTDEISAILEDYQIKQIDARFLPNEATRRVNQKIKETILSGNIYDPGQQAGDTATAMAELQKGLSPDQRFIKPSDIPSVTWKEILKDLEWELEIDVTGENKDVQGAMATLTTVLQTISTNPAVLADPNVKLVFSKILSLAGGISPVEISSTPAQPLQQNLPPATQPMPTPMTTAPVGSAAA